MIKTEEINLGVALFSVNTLRYYVTTNDIPAQLSRENMIDKRQDKTRQCFIWSLIQSYVYRLYPNNLKLQHKLHTSGTVINVNLNN